MNVQIRAMNQEVAEAPEGRTFFIVLDLLMGLGVVMAVVSVGVLLLAAVSA